MHLAWIRYSPIVFSYFAFKQDRYNVIKTREISYRVLPSFLRGGNASKQHSDLKEKGESEMDKKKAPKNRLTDKNNGLKDTQEVLYQHEFRKADAAFEKAKKESD